jgi:hypothetical protein
MFVGPYVSTHGVIGCNTYIFVRTVLKPPSLYVGPSTRGGGLNTSGECSSSGRGPYGNGAEVKQSSKEPTSTRFVMVHRARWSDIVVCGFKWLELCSAGV